MQLVPEPHCTALVALIPLRFSFQRLYKAKINRVPSQQVARNPFTYTGYRQGSGVRREIYEMLEKLPGGSVDGTARKHVSLTRKNQTNTRTVCTFRTGLLRDFMAMVVLQVVTTLTILPRLFKLHMLQKYTCIFEFLQLE